MMETPAPIPLPDNPAYEQLLAADVSMIYRLQRKTRDCLRRAGYNTVGQLAQTAPDTLYKEARISRHSALRLHSHARAILSGAAVWYDTLPARCQQPGMMLDIETDPFNGQTPWCFGWQGGAEPTQVIVVVPERPPGTLLLADGQTVITLVQHHHAAWRLIDAAAEAHGGPVYHWGGFDAGVLKATGPADVKRTLLPRMHDLCLTTARTVALPGRSYGLKAVSAFLQYAWEGYQSWEQALYDYTHWRRQDDLHAITRACTYQREDVVALGLVWRWLVENQPPQDTAKA